MLKNTTGRLDLSRKNGDHDTYSVSCTFTGAPGLLAVQTSDHSFAIQRPKADFDATLGGEMVTVEIVCRHQVLICGSVFVRLLVIDSTTLRDRCLPAPARLLRRYGPARARR